MARGTLMILGSGEIAPSMVKVYREVLTRIGTNRGVLLDTPYGFQENVPQLTEKIVDYFDTSLHVSMEPLAFPRLEGTTELERARYVDRVRSAPFVFAGPGSPSYAMRQWGPLHLADALAQVLGADGIVCFSSAAALTLGVRTAPIYELYKVGENPHWIDGLDLLGRFGLECVVIPHFDNAEGGNHDTRFCYLGARRLAQLESMLDEGVATLGVDEHTAVILDLEADTLTVRGRRQAHWRGRQSTRDLSAGSVTPLGELRGDRPVAVAPAAVDLVDRGSIHELGERAAAGGAGSLEAISRLVTLAEGGGEGRVDPAPLVDAVLAAREAARAAGLYELADQLREALARSGVEVRDTPEGSTWALRSV